MHEGIEQGVQALEGRLDHAMWQGAGGLHEPAGRGEGCSARRRRAARMRERQRSSRARRRASKKSIHCAKPRYRGRCGPEEGRTARDAVRTFGARLLRRRKARHGAKRISVEGTAQPTSAGTHAEFRVSPPDAAGPDGSERRTKAEETDRRPARGRHGNSPRKQRPAGRWAQG